MPSILFFVERVLTLKAFQVPVLLYVSYQANLSVNKGQQALTDMNSKCCYFTVVRWMNAVYDGVCDGEDGNKNAKSNFNRKGDIQ